MKFKLGLCQMIGSVSKEKSMDKAQSMVDQAAEAGAKVVALPEMWNCPYSNDSFREYAEEESGRAVNFMAGLAKSNDLYLVGGSIPELADGKVYNTSFSFDPQGRIIGKHRKVHLFDIDIKDKIRFLESDTLTPGNSLTVIDTEFCKIGVAICYDVRFPEWFRNMALEGAKVIILPAAFNLTTGPAHWDLTMRARAVDNQVYFAAVSPGRDKDGYQAYGGTCITTPWGEFLSKADEKETIIYGEIDTEYVDRIRDQLPLLKQRRPEIY